MNNHIIFKKLIFNKFIFLFNNLNYKTIYSYNE